MRRNILGNAKGVMAVAAAGSGLYTANYTYHHRYKDPESMLANKGIRDGVIDAYESTKTNIFQFPSISITNTAITQQQGLDSDKPRNSYRSRTQPLPGPSKIANLSISNVSNDSVSTKLHPSPKPISSSKSTSIEHGSSNGGDLLRTLDKGRISFSPSSRVLGVGSYGIVREAHDMLTNRPIALKIVSKINVLQKGALRNEMLALRSIQKAGGHSSIVEFLGCVDLAPYLASLRDNDDGDDNNNGGENNSNGGSSMNENDKIGLAFEFISGGELYDSILADGPFSERTASRVISQIASALSFLHNKARVVHADIKPENILLTEDGYIKLIDFGCATELPETSKYFKLDPLKPLGTVAYAAPELLDPESFRASSAADIWSLGVVLYILLSGQHPFDRDNAGIDDDEIAKLVIDGTVVFDPSVWKVISSEAKDLVSKMLIKDPLKRISAQEILKHPWISDQSLISSGKIRGSDVRLRGFQKTQSKLQNHILTLFVSGGLKEIETNENGKDQKSQATSSDKIQTNDMEMKGLTTSVSGALDRAFRVFDKDMKGIIRWADIKKVMESNEERKDDPKAKPGNESSEEESEDDAVRYREMKGFCGVGEQISLKEGDVIFKSGDQSDYFFFIDKGSVEIVVPFVGSDGKEIEKRVAILGEGDFFGEIGLLTDRPRNATARCLKGPLNLVRLSKSDFDNIVGHGWRRGMGLTRQDPATDDDERNMSKRKAQRLVRAPSEIVAHLERVTQDRVREHVSQVLESIEGSRIITLEPGKILFREGEPSNFLYVVQSGTMNVLDKDGSVIVSRGPGDTIGEVGVMNNSPRSATLACGKNEPCTLKELNAEQLAKIMMDPECNEAFRRKEVSRRSNISRYKQAMLGSRAGTRVVVVIQQ